MSTLPESAARPGSRVPRILAALICLGLAAASVLFFARQRSARANAEAFVKRFALDLRRPEETGPMKFESEPDLAAGIAVRAALPDAPAALPSALAVGAREEEIAAARDLALDAVATRPGWAYHRFLLGQLVYGSAGAARNPSAAAIWDTWATPLRLAAIGAPGVDDVWSGLGQMYIENWKRLSASQRDEAVAALRRALQDPRFVSTRFLALSAAVGRDEAMSLLPENPELLGAAADSFSLQGDLTAAAALLARQDAAQRKRRATDLARVEGRFRARDQNGLRAACAEWAADHPTSELDDPEGRAQAARILELWPSDQLGSWDDDPRADLVRFYLDGRESAVSPQILLRTLAALADVPDHVTARARLRAGDVAGAEEVAGRPQNQGAPEWTLYDAELARLLVKQGRAREARNALDLLSPATRDSCEALLARRDVARALGDTAELAAVGQRLSSLRGSVSAQGASPEGARLSICIDPEQPGSPSLDLKLTSQGPAVIRYGWGAGREIPLFLAGERVVSLPLGGLAGARDLTVQSSVGAPVRASASFAASR
jgi:hypothetical protein